MPSDVFQWKNSSHKTASVGFGSNIKNTNRDLDRDVHHVRDQLDQLLEPDKRNELRELTAMYNAHFDSGITIQHRADIRADSDKLWQRACEELLDKITSQEQSIANAERLKLENRLLEMTPQLNCIAGSTRNCFSANTIAHALNENSIAITGLLAGLRNDAIKHESDMLLASADRRFRAYIEADDSDYRKMLETMNILKASWHKTDFTDDVDEAIDESITEVGATIQFNRTAGTIADASDTYEGEYGSISGAYVP